MPNWVINEIIFRGLPDDLRREIVQKAGSDQAAIDFETLVPSPINIWPGSVGKKHSDAFPDTHLDWATKNWKTKWNASKPTVAEADGDLTLVFKTAWSPPYGWIVALFNTFKVGFEHSWLDEGREGAIKGIWDYQRLNDLGGEAWSESDADDITKRRLHKLLWGVEEFADEDD